MADLEKFKLSSLLWEGDKTDEGSFGFLENFGNVVRSTASGYHLEDMLDSKLRRASMSKGSVPSCLLLDPDFAVRWPEKVLYRCLRFRPAGALRSRAPPGLKSAVITG